MYNVGKLILNFRKKHIIDSEDRRIARESYIAFGKNFNQMLMNIENKIDELSLELKPSIFYFKYNQSKIYNTIEEAVNDVQNIVLEDMFIKYIDKDKCNIARAHDDLYAWEENKINNNANVVFNELYKFIENELDVYRHTFENTDEFIKTFMSVANCNYIQDVGYLTTTIFMNKYHDAIKNIIINSNCKLTSEEIKHMFSNHPDNNKQKSENVIDDINHYLIFNDDADKDALSEIELNIDDDANAVYPAHHMLFGSNNKINWILMLLLIIMIIVIIVVIVRYIIKNRNNKRNTIV